VFKAGWGTPGLVGLALAGVCACGPASGSRPVDGAAGRVEPVLGAGVPVAPGATVWVRSDVPGSQVLAADAAGNIVVGSNPDLERPCTVSKLDPTGQTVLWSAPVSDAGNCFIHGMAVTPLGNVLAGVECNLEDGSIDGQIVKLTPDGAREWMVHTHRTLTVLATDPSGSAIVYSQPSGGGPSQLNVYAYDSTLVRTAILEDAGGNAPGIWGMASDPSGDVLVAGLLSSTWTSGGVTYGSPGADSAPLLMKLAPDLSVQWVRLLSGAAGRLVQVGTSAAGTVVASGFLEVGQSSWGRPVVAPSQLVLAAEANGAPRWVQDIGSSSNGAFTEPHLSVDPAGEVTETLLLRSAQGACVTPFVYEIDLAGDVMWRRILDQSCSGGQLTIQPVARADHSIVIGGLTAPTTVDGVPINNHYLFSLANSAPPMAYDHFHRTGALGANWTTTGTWSADGLFARASSASSYAAWTATPDLDSAVSVQFAPVASSYLGVIARASPSAPSRDHYAAYVDPSGHVAVARRNGYSYTYLGTTSATYGGSQRRVTLATFGSNPVVLSVSVDGQEVLHVADSSASRLSARGLAGMFDYSGSGEAFADFWMGSMSAGSGGGGGGGVIAGDGFSYSGPLGPGWQVWGGAFTVTSGAAYSSAARSYATLGAAVSGDVSVSADVSPNGLRYAGVIARAASADGSRDHYAGWLDPNGAVHLARRNGYVYSYLADGAVSPIDHRLTLQVTSAGAGARVALLVDGVPTLLVTDSSAQALTGAGKVGLFEYQGSGAAFDNFSATSP